MEEVVKAISEVKIDMKDGWIPVDEIVLDPDYQPRSTMWDDSHPKQAMKKSLKKDGVLAPLIVEVHGDFPDVRHVLISGHRRYEALKEQGVKSVYCLLRSPMTKGERLGMQIREDLSNKGFDSEERDHSWNDHYFIRHKEVCGCSHSSKMLCKFQVSKWAREMGIKISTAHNHISVDWGECPSEAHSEPASKAEAPQTEETPATESPQTKETPMIKEVEVTEKDLGKPLKGGKYNLHLTVSKDAKSAIIIRAKTKEETLSDAIEGLVKMKKCPQCGEELDQ